MTGTERILVQSLGVELDPVLFSLLPLSLNRDFFFPLAFLGFDLSASHLMGWYPTCLSHSSCSFCSGCFGDRS
jgi:hypothetical protein